jgi:hypothetical protein
MSLKNTILSSETVSIRFVRYKNLVQITLSVKIMKNKPPTQTPVPERAGTENASNPGIEPGSANEV